MRSIDLLAEYHLQTTVLVVAIHDYISELPEYKLYMDEYKYITDNESKLRIISALNENAQINTKYLKDISHQINETSIMNKDKLKAAADINSLLTGALLVKKSLMIYAVRMIVQLPTVKTVGLNT